MISTSRTPGPGRGVGQRDDLLDLKESPRRAGHRLGGCVVDGVHGCGALRLVVDPRRRARQLPYDEIAMTSERSRLLELGSGWRSHSDAQRRQSYVAPIACHMYRGSLPR